MIRSSKNEPLDRWKSLLSCSNHWAWTQQSPDPCLGPKGGEKASPVHVHNSCIWCINHQWVLMWAQDVSSHPSAVQPLVQPPAALDTFSCPPVTAVTAKSARLQLHIAAGMSPGPRRMQATKEILRQRQLFTLWGGYRPWESLNKLIGKIFSQCFPVTKKWIEPSSPLPDPWVWPSPECSIKNQFAVMMRRRDVAGPAALHKTQLACLIFLLSSARADLSVCHQKPATYKFGKDQKPFIENTFSKTSNFIVRLLL